MVTARDMMHPGVECIGEHDTLEKAARMMRDFGVGALPICGDDDRLHGIITDRDIVIGCIAVGANPQSVTAGDLARGRPVTVEADANLTAVLRAMTDHKVKRMPVLDQHRLVGMISESDLARHLSEDDLAAFVEGVYARA